MPTTPRPPYPWDLQEQGQDSGNGHAGVNSQQQQEIQPQQQVQQHQQQEVNLSLYSRQAHSPNPNPPLQMIQLEERPAAPVMATGSSSQCRGGEGASHERPEGQHKPRIRVDTTSPLSAMGPTRGSAEPTAARGYHPYRRPQTGHGDVTSAATASGSGSRRRDESQSQSHVRFAGQGQPQGSMSAPRIASLGSSIGSTKYVFVFPFWLDAVLDVCRPLRPVFAFCISVPRWPAVRVVSLHSRNRNLRRKIRQPRRRANSSSGQMSTTTRAY